MSSEKKTTVVKCPQCGKSVEWRPENKWRPFCSERCRQIDLGAWASESYRVSGEAQEDQSAPPVNE